LAQQFEALGSGIGRLAGQAGDIAARFRKARDEPGGHWVPSHPKDDWYGRCRLLDRNDRCGSPRDNDIHTPPQELGRDLCETLVASLPPAILDGDGSILDPAEFAQSLYKGGETLANACWPPKTRWSAACPAAARAPRAAKPPRRRAA